MSLEDFFSSLADQFFRDSGLTKEDLLTLIQNIIEESKSQNQQNLPSLKSLTVQGGFDKEERPEKLNLCLKPGDIYGVTGLTGSGKTQFLEDIEYIALGDSPSRRKILINGEVPSEENRENLENRLCASLSQSMNFVMELSTRDFISMHIDCRKVGLSNEEKENLLNEVLACANSLAGEKIQKESVITQLSGGQSRALMIADIALVSDAAVVLIDEPENAGIDKEEILKILSSKGKIVLVSTHDPVIALSCPKRILIKNGGVEAVIERTKEEEILLEELKAFDSKLLTVRNAIREGKNVC
ncbi:MAG: ATP-binding cassette domain-containing protein [Treponema sp.]|nr:ATP-binding cassette domain-containing protein [Treponema sp.]